VGKERGEVIIRIRYSYYKRNEVVIKIKGSY
jgi:hypothetical protein